MPTKTLKINFTIPVGSSLKLGYRPIGSEDPFIYIEFPIAYNQTPYNITLDDAFLWEFELTTICGTCDSGGDSTSIIIQETLEV
jgi:hypothetical protein